MAYRHRGGGGGARGGGEQHPPYRDGRRRRMPRRRRRRRRPRPRPRRRRPRRRPAAGSRRSRTRARRFAASSTTTITKTHVSASPTAAPSTAAMAKELVQKLAYVAPSQLGQPEASKKFMIRADHFFVNVAHNLFHNDVWEISTAAMAKELTQKLFVTETALAPPAAAAAASQVGQAEAEKAPEVDLAPVPKKAALAHPARPSAGTAWKKAMIRADRFLLKVADNKLFHYDVSINPEPKSRQTLSELIKVHGNTPLGGKLPAYDGRKSLYAAGSLPFESEEFTVRLVDPEKKDKERAEREYRSTIRIAGRTDLYHQETIRVLNVVLRKSPSWKYVTVSRSFLSTTFGLRGDIGEGLECWRGYYQSLRPTQMGLSLNLDMSGTSIFMPVVVIRSAQEFLNLHDVSRLLNDRDRVKVVALMDCPEITKYRGLVSAQPHRQEIIEVSSVIKDPQRGTVNGGMIREVLIAFGRNTGRRPERTIFYRDGVSEGQFSHVLLHEMDALQKVSKGHITLDDAVFPNGTTGHALEDLEKVATDLRASFWKQMSDAGIKYIPSNTFSYYDQVLDTTAMLGAVPDRYSWTGGEIGHDTYFSMARGNATVPAMEMTKWFDTSYRFIIPELSPETKFSYASHKAVSEYKEAKVVPINPESKSRQELIKLHGKTSLGSKLPAYDGRKSLYTAGSLPFESVDPEKKDKERDEREYRITIQIAGRTDLYHLQQFLCRRQRDMAQETIQVLDVVLEPYSRESPFWNYVTVSKSFFLTTFGHRGDIGEGLECWRGYYQSLCPSQMGLLLNIATSFFKKVFAQEFLNLRDVSWPLTDRDRVKIKKALRGVRVETNRQTNQIRRYKITGLTNVPMSQLIGTRMSVVHYFDDYKLQHTNWPCLQSGSDSRPVYLPMEACKIIQGKRYFKKLNDKQVTNILRATCQRPQQREQSICEMVLYNKYAEDKFAQEFGIKVCSDLALVPARVLPPPMLRYHDTGRDRTCAPSAGQWNMINKKVINGGVRDNWACLNFSHVRPEELYRFLIQMCNATGMLVCPRPVVDIRSAVSEVPTIIFGADVTHPPPGQDSASSISAGTIRPTHYHVLYDENHFTADAIESPNNNLCYTYGCYTRAVSGVEGHCSDGCSIPDSSRQAANTEESHSRAIQGLVRILDKTFCLPFTMDMLVEEVVASVFKTLNISFDHWVKVNNKVASPGRKLCTMVDINDKEFSLYISPRLRGGTRNINRNLITKKPLLDHIISISENLFDVVLFPRRLHYPGMTPYLIGLQDVSINLVILLINLVHQNYPKHCPGRFTHSSILYCVETNELSFDPEVGQFDYSEELYYQNLSDLAEVLSEIFLYSEEFLFANRPSLHVYGTRPANNTWRLPRLLNFLVHDLKKTVRKFPLDIPKNRKYLEEHIGILSGAARFAYLLACELDVGYDGDENDIEFHIGMVEEPDPHPVPEPQPSAPEAPAQLPHPAPQPQPEITLLHKSSQPWKLSSQPQSEPPPTRQKRRNFVKVPCWRRKANKSSVFARLFDTRDYETQRVGSQWSYGRNWVGHSRKYFWKLSTKQAEAFLQLIFAALMYNIRLRMHCPEVPVDWAEGPCPIPHHAGFNRHNYTKLGPQCIYARRVNRVTNRLAKFNCCR